MTDRERKHAQRARDRRQAIDATGGSQSEPPVSASPTLSEAGIDKDLSARALPMATMPDTRRSGHGSKLGGAMVS